MSTHWGQRVTDIDDESGSFTDLFKLIRSPFARARARAHVAEQKGEGFCLMHERLVACQFFPREKEQHGGRAAKKHTRHVSNDCLDLFSSTCNPSRLIAIVNPAVPLQTTLSSALRIDGDQFRAGTFR